MRTCRPNWLSQAALTATLVAGVTAAAPASADQQTVKLIQLLIQKGILTSGQAGELLRESGPATSHGLRARHAPPPIEGNEPAPAATKPGEIRVTYVPQFIRKQIADQVRAQVMTEAQQEGWAAPDALPEWTKRVRVFGDLRTRYESDMFNKNNFNQFFNFAAINAGSPFDIEQLASGGALPPFLNTTQDRTRFRLRARFGVEAQLDDTVTANIRVGTGDPNGPVSTNATLGENGPFSKYAIYLDRAFMAFKPDPDILVEAGRTSNPFSTTDILFYNDLGFDGASAQYAGNIIPGLHTSVTAGAFPLFNTDFAFSSTDPNKFASTDSYLFAGQLAADYTFRADLIGHLAAGFYDFVGVQGAVSHPCSIATAPNVYDCNTDDTRYLNGQFGNTVYAIRNIVPYGTGQYNPQYFGLASRFAVMEVHPRLEIDTYAPVDIQLEADFIKNLAYNRDAILSHGPGINGPVGPQNNLGSSAAGQFTRGPYQGGDTGYMVKLAVGYPTIRHRWDWSAYAAYKYIETDATIDSLNDSEFHLGGTNARGYVLQGTLGIAERTNVSLRWLSSQVVSGPPDGNDVVLLDLNASF